MNIKVIDNYIFDFDGTLVDTAPDIIDCLKKSFLDVLKINNIKIDRNIIGPPINEMLKKIKPDINDQDAVLLTKRFRVCYDGSSFSNTFLFDSVKELLMKLKDRRKNVILVTNKPQLPTTKLVKKLDIDLFNKVITPDILSGKKMNKSEMIHFLLLEYKLDSNKSLMIGDTAEDAIAARENKIDSAIVLKGYGSKKAIQEIKPRYVFNDICELLTEFNK